MINKRSKKVIWWFGILVLIIGGIYIWYHPIKLSSDVVIPTKKGDWKQNLFIIEEPNKNLDSNLTDQSDIPPLYQDLIPDINPEVQSYLEKRNNYIKGFLALLERDKKNPIDQRFIYINADDQLLPVISNGNDRILLVKSMFDYSDGTIIYLLSTDYLILDQQKINHKFHRTVGSCVISTKFMDRVWIQTFEYSATNEDLFIDTLSIQNDRITIKEFYAGNDLWETNPFDRYKIVNPKTNPRIRVHKKRPFDFLTLFFLFIPLIFIPFIAVLVVVFTIIFIIRRRKKRN
jgi:hypothetical protein